MCSQPRTRAFRKLITLLKPGGCMAITLRHGPAEPERGIHAASQIIEGEQAASLEALTAEYFDRFHPATPEERDLVDTMITAV